MWGRGDSNSHASRHMILNHARLPIPTLPQGRRRTALRGTLKPKLYAPSARAVHAEQGVRNVGRAHGPCGSAPGAARAHAHARLRTRRSPAGAWKPSQITSCVHVRPSHGQPAPSTFSAYRNHLALAIMLSQRPPDAQRTPLPHPPRPHPTLSPPRTPITPSLSRSTRSCPCPT